MPTEPRPREVLAAALHVYFGDDHDLPSNVAPQCERAAVLAEAQMREDGYEVAPFSRSFAAGRAAVLGESELRTALAAIRDMEPEDVELPDHPADCPECARWKDHPVQRGICDARYRELHARDDRARSNRMALGYRMKMVARTALAAHPAEAEPEGRRE